MNDYFSWLKVLLWKHWNQIKFCPTNYWKNSTKLNMLMLPKKMNCNHTNHITDKKLKLWEKSKIKINESYKPTQNTNK